MRRPASPVSSRPPRHRDTETGPHVTVSGGPAREPRHRRPALVRDYYLTPRAQHPDAQNKYSLALSIPRILAFDAFHLVEDLLTQPVLIVAGSAAGSLWHSTELYSRARGSKKRMIVDGGVHMDFYDVPKYVDRAVAEFTPSFREQLAVGSDS